MSRLWGKIRIQLCKAVWHNENYIVKRPPEKISIHPPLPNTNGVSRWKKSKMDRLSLCSIYLLFVCPCLPSHVPSQLPTWTPMLPSYTKIHPWKQLPHLTEAYNSRDNNNNNPFCNHNPLSQLPCLQCFDLSQAFRRNQRNLTNLYYFPFNLICRSFV